MACVLFRTDQWQGQQVVYVEEEKSRETDAQKAKERAREEPS